MDRDGFNPDKVPIVIFSLDHYNNRLYKLYRAAINAFGLLTHPKGLLCPEDTRYELLYHN